MTHKSTAQGSCDVLQGISRSLCDPTLPAPRIVFAHCLITIYAWLSLSVCNPLGVRARPSRWSHLQGDASRTKLNPTGMSKLLQNSIWPHCRLVSLIFQAEDSLPSSPSSPFPSSYSPPSLPHPHAPSLLGKGKPHLYSQCWAQALVCSLCSGKTSGEASNRVHSSHVP